MARPLPSTVSQFTLRKYFSSNRTLTNWKNWTIIVCLCLCMKKEKSFKSLSNSRPFVTENGKSQKGKHEGLSRYKLKGFSSIKDNTRWLSQPTKKLRSQWRLRKAMTRSHFHGRSFYWFAMLHAHTQSCLTYWGSSHTQDASVVICFNALSFQLHWSTHICLTMKEEVECGDIFNMD